MEDLVCVSVYDETSQPTLDVYQMYESIRKVILSVTAQSTNERNLSKCITLLQKIFQHFVIKTSWYGHWNSSEVIQFSVATDQRFG